MDWKLSRRRSLALLSFAICTAPLSHAAPLDSVPLFPDDSHSLYRTRILLEIEGNAEVPKNAITTDATRKIPVEGDSVIDYEEHLFRDEDSIAMAARRYYYEASTKAQIQKSNNQSKLRNEARRAAIQLDASRSVLYAERTQFTDQELQLLQVPVNSLAIDRLLPHKSVQVDESWSIDDEVLTVLLDMDAIQKSSVVASLTSFDDDTAKMQMVGTISASVDGVPTSIQLRGKMTFDRRQRAITWLALALREDREVGKAEPGFEIAAQIRILRQALEKPHALKSPKPIDLEAAPPSDQLLIDVHSKPGGFGVMCGRGWRVMTSKDRFTLMRMIENDKVVAQCDVRALPPLKEGMQLTLEAFQEDIQRTLGDRFGEFLEAEERVTNSQLRLIRVVAQGSVEKIPVQWIYTHFSNDEGRRCAAIFTLADKQVEAFGGGDLQFIEGFRFVEPTSKPKDEAKQVAQSSATTLQK